jgi:Kef-type K+ transport system membrane component KefB
MSSIVIVGYLLAGSLVGPGGLNLISEMMQVS